MKKILFILLFLHLFPLQGTVAFAFAKDSLRVAIDTSSVKQIHFDTNFKEKYQEKPFIYEEKTPVQSLWERFQEWFTQWLKRNFDVQDSQKAMTILDYAVNIMYYQP